MADLRGLIEGLRERVKHSQASPSIDVDEAMALYTSLRELAEPMLDVVLAAASITPVVGGEWATMVRTTDLDAVASRLYVLRKALEASQ